MTERSKTDMDPWYIYDTLIEGVPEGIPVTDYCIGSNWCYVDAGCGCGISHAVRGGGRRTFHEDPCSIDLHALAKLAKSWNFEEATLGTAALNSWYSRREAIEKKGAFIDVEHVGRAEESNPFTLLKESYAEKKVTVVGHFPNVNSMFATADVTVLERNCASPLDTPDSACEYILPQQDYVLMTGTTFINKTMPRLLELSQKATTVVVGPSAIPSVVLAEAGAQAIAGSVVVNKEPAKASIKGGTKEQWRAGIKKFFWAPQD
ncbi:Rossmann-like domain-containing protein [Cryptobacterium curtum]|uniref:Rossmann-like domain-containing protein n=1 Tax=Cryptobacterium curtum TaxID=84163 RepID=UPI00248DDEDD|nr:DUF364 domain-containing protein [Cryptobacterium curtum]